MSLTERRMAEAYLQNVEQEIDTLRRRLNVLLQHREECRAALNDGQDKAGPEEDVTAQEPTDSKGDGLDGHDAD